MFDWTWLELVKWQMMYWTMFGLASIYLHVPQTWPLLRVSTHVLTALQNFLIMERTVCELVSAILTLMVPIYLLVQPEMTLTADSKPTFHESVLRPVTDSSINILLMNSIGMSFPLLILYQSDSKGLLSQFVRPYIVAVALPMCLTFATLLLIFLGRLLFRPTVHKDLSDAFLMSLLSAGAIFLIIHVQRRVEEDPWGLDAVWKGYKKAAKMAEQITGCQIMSLEVEIDRHRVQDQDVGHAEAPDPTVPSSSHGAGPLFAHESSEMGSTDAVEPGSENLEEDRRELRAAQDDTDVTYSKDKDV